VVHGMSKKGLKMVQNNHGDNPMDLLSNNHHVNHSSTKAHVFGCRNSAFKFHTSELYMFLLLTHMAETQQNSWG